MCLVNFDPYEMLLIELAEKQYEHESDGKIVFLLML